MHKIVEVGHVIRKCDKSKLSANINHYFNEITNVHPYNVR